MFLSLYENKENACDSLKSHFNNRSIFANILFHFKSKFLFDLMKKKFQVYCVLNVTFKINVNPIIDNQLETKKIKNFTTLDIFFISH